MEYQQGTLYGYEVREYLLEKFKRTCVYCGKQNVPLEIDHIIPKSRDGSSRVANLAIACHACNLDKDDRTAEEYGHPEVQACTKRPLNDAAAVNATRWELWHQLEATGLPVSSGSGGCTKFNRVSQHYPKAHWIDAACVGISGEKVYLDLDQHQPLLIKAVGRQSRQMTLPDQYGFPRTTGKAASSVHGFKTGDLVKAVVTKGKKTGVYVGRVAVRATGYFDITTPHGCISGVSYRYCKAVHRADGYSYQNGESATALA